jgi:uncharacterized damage-inducible protein DinB
MPRAKRATTSASKARKATTKTKPVAKGKKPATKPATKPRASAPNAKSAPASKRILPDVERVIKELQRQHDGDPWHGPSRAAILADVSAAEAAWQPGAGAHSIWDLVLHMRSWTREVERRALGAQPAMPEDGDWPEVISTSEEAWAEAQASLDAAHERIVAVVRRLGAERLSGMVGATRDKPLGTGITHRAMLYSLAQHDVYHSGQVAILKRMARAALESKY